MTAFGALYDWRLPEASEPALRAALYRIGDFGSTEPVLGAQIIFYVGSERVCDAISGASESIYATCTDPAAIAKVVSKGDGYTAVFRETDTLNRATGWGASMQTQIKHFP